MNKKAYIILAIIFITVTVIINYYETKDDGCRAREYFLNISINGVVKSKYYDRTRHGIPVIEVENIDSIGIKKISFLLELSNSYDLIKIGDTLNKEINSDLLYVYKNQKVSLLKKLQFDCKKR